MQLRPAKARRNEPNWLGYIPEKFDVCVSLAFLNEFWLTDSFYPTASDDHVLLVRHASFKFASDPVDLLNLFILSWPKLKFGSSPVMKSPMFCPGVNPLCLIVALPTFKIISFLQKCRFQRGFWVKRHSRCKS